MNLYKIGQENPETKAITVWGSSIHLAELFLQEGRDENTVIVHYAKAEIIARWLNKEWDASEFVNNAEKLLR